MHFSKWVQGERRNKEGERASSKVFVSSWNILLSLKAKCVGKMKNPNRKFIFPEKKKTTNSKKT